jgi:murein DD-endopeptidase MepM/ murein hydrolase activator NlpD
LKTRLVHIISFAGILILLMSANLYALSVDITPRNVKPGDVFLVKIKSTDTSPIKAKFLDRDIDLHHAENGNHIALVPLDINTPPGTHKIHIRHGKKKFKTSVRVTAPEFRTIHLTLPESKVTLSPKDQRRTEKEYILQKKIWDTSTKRVWQGQFTYPTDTEVSTEFGVKRIMNEKKTSVHRGMDFRGKKGTPVKALNAGTVVLTKDLFYGGNTLIVDHGMGLYSVYMHLSRFNVKEGSSVDKGQTVGFVGSSGRATGPHLHLSVKLDGFSVNPESLFKLEL